MNDLEKRLQKLADERPTLAVKISDILPNSGLTGELKVRDLTSGEVLDATASAVQARKAVLTALPKEYTHEFLSDPKFLADAQSVEEMARAYRLPNDVSRPAFTSGATMHQLLTTGQLTTMYAYFEKAKTLGGEKTAPTQSDLDGLVEVCVANPAEAMAALMRLPKHVFAELFVMLAARARVLADRAAAHDAA